MTGAHAPCSARPVDLSNHDLKRASFRGRDLRGARFCNADLRGADFSTADLRGADFSGARAGQTPEARGATVAAAVALSIALGVVTGRVARAFADTITDPRVHAIARAATLACLMVVLGLTVVFGFRAGGKGVLAIVATLLALALTARVLGVGTGVIALEVAAVVTLALVVLAIGALARAVAGHAGDALFVLCALSGAIAGRLSGGGVGVVALAVAAALLGRRLHVGDPRYSGLAKAALALACTGGTRFTRADLERARFDGARLEGSDFRGARVEGARLEGARGVEGCRFGDAPRDQRFDRNG